MSAEDILKTTFITHKTIGYLAILTKFRREQVISKGIFRQK